ncbi:MAG: tRNA preQ1(34) S-adenosylmethionine ribosyltransferase-isomerase QueA [Thermoplasmata archaeon]|nr:MAG: tRNA preQ1(34) S-adenosylmethionine ribosyltransferase-isomerase QueA [Thermoplasmata archaeon]
MDISLFDYELPKELIAQEPIEERDKSKLMVLAGNRIEHRRFYELVEYLEKGDTLIINDSKVIHAKLKGKKETGGKVEVLLVRNIEGSIWECLIRGRKIREGTKIFFKNLKAEVIQKKDKFILKFDRENLEEYLEKWGEVPLPPYIKKELKNASRYQTVYAKKPGSIAAPTAGLHFSEKLLTQIEKKGVKIAPITLHVSIGTFKPVKVEDITKHKMEAEYFEISKKSAEIINNTEGKVIAVGTTTVRAIESSSVEGRVIPKKDWTNLFIYPSYKFRSPIRGLITNFHLPRSTLLMLVCAFAGREKILRAYKEAISKRYRFYSFGDAMLIFK